MWDSSGHGPDRATSVTFRPRPGWVVTFCMAILALIGLLPLWSAWYIATQSTLGLSGNSDLVIPQVIVGLFLLAFPTLFIWSLRKGWPRLELGQGWLRRTTLFGRVTVLNLSDYAEAVLGEDVLGKGYQPRLEFWPVSPGEPTILIPLRPYVRHRQDAEALLAQVHDAAGQRPAPSGAQTLERTQKTRRDYLILAGIIALCLILLAALNLNKT
jgi:hypothetical protein